MNTVGAFFSGSDGDVWSVPWGPFVCCVHALFDTLFFQFVILLLFSMFSFSSCSFFSGLFFVVVLGSLGPALSQRHSLRK